MYDSGCYFSSLVTYYVEGLKGHMMKALSAKPERSYAVRGNCFSIALPWERIQQQFKRISQELPLGLHPPAVAKHFVRVMFQNADSTLFKHIKDLKVRTAVILALVETFAGVLGRDARNSTNASAGLVDSQDVTVTVDSIIDTKAKLAAAVETYYPSTVYGGDGSVLEGMEELVAKIMNCGTARVSDTGSEEKNQTMPEAATEVADLFQTKRQNLVTDDAVASHMLGPQLRFAASLVPQTQMKIPLHLQFEEFDAEMLTREACWLLGGVLRSRVIKDVCGGFSGAFKMWLRLFFQDGADFERGGVVHGQRQNYVIVAKLNTALAGEDALGQIWNVKGSSGLKPCMFCLNVVAARSSVPDGMVSFESADTSAFALHTDESLWEAADSLIKQAAPIHKQTCRKRSGAWVCLWTWIRFCYILS